MIKHKDIRGFKCRYHRNGIMGEGFFVCRFRFLRERDSQLMQAIVFDGKGPTALKSHVRIGATRYLGRCR